jgi:phosphatidylinositol alpha-1,6-mannosyltransferase
VARHLLVTNDFPPKVGGIQTYLWELWRRLPPEDVTVLTTPHAEAAAFDASQPYRIERTGAREQVLLPHPGLARRIDALADEVGAAFVVLDPAIPLGLVGPSLRHRYGLVLHGSELLGRVPGGSQLMGQVVQRAIGVVAAGGYPASEAQRVGGGRTPPVTDVPPGVDADRFRPPTADQRRKARADLGVPDDAFLVAGLSRLVQRKGFDVLIDAVGQLAPAHPELVLLIGGGGRDADRLRGRIERTGAPARLVGRVADDAMPAFYGAADVFAMCCRTRWGGLEPEGFGIVFLEAAACGVAQIAGDSGGAADAVADGETGLVVRRPGDPREVAAAIERLVEDAELRHGMGERSRRRVEAGFTYDLLAARLAGTLEAWATSAS